MTPPPILPLTAHLAEAEARINALIAEWALAYPGHPAVRANGDGTFRVLDPDLEVNLFALAREAGRADYKRALAEAERRQREQRDEDPYLGTPIPSAAGFQLVPAANTPPGFVVPRGSPIRPAAGTNTLTGDETSVIFRTAQDVQLWPREVAEAEIVHTGRRYEVRFTLRGPGGAAGRPERLPVMLNGGPEVTFPLYEALVTAAEVTANGRAIGVRPRGFADDEALLPDQPLGLPGTRQLIELAVFPERFLFLDLFGVELGAGDVRVAAALSGDWSPLVGKVSADNLRLNAVPAVNAVRVGGVPVSPSPDQFCDRIDPNNTPGGPVRVLEVLEVRTAPRPGVAGRVVPGLFDVRDTHGGPAPDLYHNWHRRDGRTGEAFIRLVTAANEPVRREDLPPALEVDVLAFHGDLPCDPRKQVRWTCAGLRANVLVGPTPALWPADAATAARMGCQSTTGRGHVAGPALRHRVLSLLALRHWVPSAAAAQLAAQRGAWLRSAALGISQFESTEHECEVVLGPALPQSVRGERCAVTVIPGNFPGGSAFLFGQVLDQVLADRCGPAAFTELSLTDGSRVFHRWHHRVPRFHSDEPLPQRDGNQ
jgi:type VI secretion system protein ImpG